MSPLKKTKNKKKHGIFRSENSQKALGRLSNPLFDSAVCVGWRRGGREARVYFCAAIYCLDRNSHAVVDRELHKKESAHGRHVLSFTLHDGFSIPVVVLFLSEASWEHLN